MGWGEVCVNDRPHPGPLPRGEGETLPAFRVKSATGLCECADATLRATQSHSLSPGERARVRASVNPFILPSPIEIHDPERVAAVWHPFRMRNYFRSFRGCRARWLLNPRLISGIAPRCSNCGYAEHPRNGDAFRHALTEQTTCRKPTVCLKSTYG